MNEYTVLGERLKELLEKNNMSQRELAEKIGITEVTISRYISAQRIPKATEIAKLADALNCSCDYLLGFQNELTKETEMETAIHNLKVFRTFLDDKWKNNIDIAIQAINLQISMKKHCNSHDCNDCRTNGMCARTFMLDELQ